MSLPSSMARKNESPQNAAMREILGYSKYDYKNKDTDNSRNGHSTKTMHTSYGDMEMAGYLRLCH